MPEYKKVLHEADLYGKMVLKASFDTINKRLIYGGDFKVTRNDLMEIPFIGDDEIKALNIKDNNFIRVGRESFQKIVDLKAENSYGVQFAVTLDGKPILTGYFWDPLSRFTCNTYQIMVPRKSSHLNKRELFFYEANRNHVLKSEKIIYPKELIEAFRDSNRLLE